MVLARLRAIFASKSAAEARYTLLLEHSNDVLCEMRNGRLTYVSPITSIVGGLSAADFIGKPITDILHPDDIPAFMQYYLPGWSGAVRARARVRDGEGAWRWREITGVRVIEPDGEPRAVVVLRDIDDRKRAEDALVERERSLRTIVANLPVVLFGFDAQGVVTLAQGMGLENLGTTGEAMIGRCAFDIFPDESEISGLLRRALGGESFTTTMRLGDVILETYFNPIIDETHAVTGVTGVAIDITERALAEEALTASEERYRNLVENASDVVYTHDLQGNFLTVNGAGSRLFGYSQEEIRTLNIRDVIDPAHLQLSIENIARRARGEGGQSTRELVIRAKDGSPVWVEVSAGVIEDGGVVVGGRGFARDITERKRAESERAAAEAALRDSEERFRSLSGASPIGIFHTDIAGRCQYTNARWQEIAGLSFEQALGEGWAGAIHPEDARAVFEGWADAVAANREFEMEFRFRTPAGEVAWVHSRASATRDGSDVTGFVGTVEDITARRLIEEEREALVREMERQTRELDAFTYSISHDLKEPLRTLHAFSDFLTDDYAGVLDDQGRDYLARIGSASSRMKRMIEDLLELSRIGRDAPAPERIDLERALADIFENEQARIIETGATVRVQAGLPAVAGTAVRVEQIFGNLIANALKFTGDTAPIVEVGARAAAGEWGLFFVRDNGIGIDPEYHDRIFGIFQRLHRREEYEGSGAGLAIVKRAVESAGGAISVESAPGAGTTFVFTLPLWAEATKEEAA